MLNTEIWKEVEDLPYDISNLGNVRRNASAKYKHKGNKFVKPYINNKGYMCINLYKNSKVHKFPVHRLIAIAFIPNPAKLPEVNHIDGNPLNNTLGNLEWCTHKQNIQHAWDTGLFTNRRPAASSKRKGSSSKFRGVSWSKERKRWCVHVTFNKKHYSAGRYSDELEAAKAYDAFIIEKDLLKEGYKLNFS